MTLRSKILIFFCLMLGVGIIACKKQETEVPDFKFQYFPVNKNHYVIYQVDSTYYDDFQDSILRFSYQIKETIVEEFKDNSGRPTQRLERAIRKTTSDSWQVINEWNITRTNTNAERTENNVKYLKLKFPPKKGAHWNGNIYNGDDEWDYEINDVDVARDVNSVHFDQTLSMTLIADTTNLIYYKLYTEKYGMNAGLIEKEIIDIESNSPNIQVGVPILERITKGFKVSYKIVEYGD